ncbi:hypothetical protein ACFLWN_04485 [Chloroflexota bacterium]
MFIQFLACKLLMSFIIEVKAVPVVLDLTIAPSVGTLVRRLRIALQLTQQGLAKSAGVLKEDIDLLENNLPVPLGAKIKILMELQQKIQPMQKGYMVESE